MHFFLLVLTDIVNEYSESVNLKCVNYDCYGMFFK